METEVAAKSVGGEIAKLKRNFYAALIFAIILFIVCIVLVILLVTGSSNESSSNDESTSTETTPSPTTATWTVPSIDESDYDDGSGIDLDCTPKAQQWTYAPDFSYFFWTQEVCDGLYAYGDNAYSQFFMVTSSGVIVVDAPRSMTAALPHVVASVTSNPITTVIYSHQHADHIGGAAALPNIDSAEIICHSDANESIATHWSTKDIVPVCTTTLDLNADNDTYFVVDDDKYLIIKYSGYRSHTNNDLVLFASRQRTVMVVDIVWPGWVPWQSIGYATDPQAVRAMHDYLLDEVVSDIYGEWEVFVAGHMDQLGDRQSVVTNAEYFDDTIAAVGVALGLNQTQYGAIFEQLGLSEGWSTPNLDLMLVVKTWYNAVDAACVDILIEDGWDTRLRGFDGFAVDNCHTIWLDYYNVDIS